MTHATVLLVLDACRGDYVRPDTMPVLHGLLRDGLAGEVESTAGFAQRTALFTGRYPDTSGTFGQFAFDPRRSPFRWVRLLGPARGLVQPRRALYPVRRAIERLSGPQGAHADPAWIPPHALPSFAPGEPRVPSLPGAFGAASLFDACRRAGLRFRDLTPVQGDEAVVRALVGGLRQRSGTELHVARLRDLDDAAHRDGPFADSVRREQLPLLDQRIASVHAALTANHDTWDLVLVAPHGMAPVEREVDVLAALERVPARPGKDYVVFVNSTVAVFWYLTEAGRRAVERALPGVPGTHIVTEAERRRRRIPTERRWGDRMLAAEPGVVFWPDYFHVQDSAVQGMHGFLDKRDEGNGVVAILSSPGRVPARSLGVRPLVDVLPTMCELLRLPLPASNEGTSLLRNTFVSVPATHPFVAAAAPPMPLPALPPMPPPAP